MIKKSRSTYSKITRIHKEERLNMLANLKKNKLAVSNNTTSFKLKTTILGAFITLNDLWKKIQKTSPFRPPNITSKVIKQKNTVFFKTLSKTFSPRKYFLDDF